MLKLTSVVEYNFDRSMKLQISTWLILINVIIIPKWQQAAILDFDKNSYNFA